MAEKIGVVGLITSITDNVKQLIKKECIMHIPHKYRTGDYVPNRGTTTFVITTDNPFAPPDTYNKRVDKQAKRTEWQDNKRSYRSKINY